MGSRPAPRLHKRVPCAKYAGWFLSGFLGASRRSSFFQEPLTCFERARTLMESSRCEILCGIASTRSRAWPEILRATGWRHSSGYDALGKSQRQPRPLYPRTGGRHTQLGRWGLRPRQAGGIGPSPMAKFWSLGRNEHGLRDRHRHADLLRSCVLPGQVSRPPSWAIDAFQEIDTNGHTMP